MPRIKLLYKLQGTGFGLDEKMQVLQVEKKLPPALVSNALSVLVANREYQERALARTGLKRMYIGTLTLSLFMAVLGGAITVLMMIDQRRRRAFGTIEVPYGVAIAAAALLVLPAILPIDGPVPAAAQVAQTRS